MPKSEIHHVAAHHHILTYRREGGQQAGIRVAAVQVVATATLGALVGWGGLGRYIIDGFSQRDFVELVVGAILVALLSILTDAGFGVLERVVAPRGLPRPTSVA